MRPSFMLSLNVCVCLLKMVSTRQTAVQHYVQDEGKQAVILVLRRAAPQLVGRLPKYTKLMKV